MTFLSKTLRKLVKPKKKEIKFDFEVDIPAVQDFLIHIDSDAKELRRLVKTLRELHDERKILRSEKHKHDNMRKQILVFDKLIQQYQYLTDDADVNANRLKGLREHFLEIARKHHPDLHDKYKDELRWYYDW